MKKLIDFITPKPKLVGASPRWEFDTETRKMVRTVHGERQTRDITKAESEEMFDDWLDRTAW